MKNKSLVVELLDVFLNVALPMELCSHGYVNTMHQANEFTEVEDLYRAAAIYTRGYL